MQVDKITYEASNINFTFWQRLKFLFTGKFETISRWHSYDGITKELKIFYRLNIQNNERI